eukprot:TRINITY_DN931_c1_g2_i1.p2 TRINITY_DN931_c1_g2~~TRINITY_DN931_c1_g2_i1.p2  ORF type:complete len:304 (+),score=137.03 TRINITY_DN931_c1_g2_i1:44-955(+)
METDMMKTDEELAAEGLDAEDDDLDDFDMDVADVKQGGAFESIVQSTNNPGDKWAEVEHEVRAKAAAEQRAREERSTAVSAAVAAAAAVVVENAPEPEVLPPPVEDEAAKAQKEAEYHYKLLAHSYFNLPQPKDSEKAAAQPARQRETPSYYPQTQHPILSNPATFAKFEEDTLFFAFYYQQQSFQQYLAATQLKEKQWRFHKKLKSWFQRNERTEQTEEYETGTYTCFSTAEDAWGPEQQVNFKLEYSQLEDELPVPKRPASQPQAQPPQQQQQQQQQPPPQEVQQPELTEAAAPQAPQLQL